MTYIHGLFSQSHAGSQVGQTLGTPGDGLGQSLEVMLHQKVTPDLLTCYSHVTSYELALLCLVIYVVSLVINKHRKVCTGTLTFLSR